MSPFSNTENKINICENIHNKMFFIIQTGTNDSINYVNDYIMETLLLIVMNLHTSQIHIDNIHYNYLFNM